MDKMLRKFTKEGIFVTKTAFLKRIVKDEGHSNLEGGCLSSV